MEAFTLEDAATHNAIVKNPAVLHPTSASPQLSAPSEATSPVEEPKDQHNQEEMRSEHLDRHQAVEVGSTARIKDEMWQIAVRRFIEMIHPINFSTRFPR